MPADDSAKLDQILAQVTATNGRVTALEGDMIEVKRDQHEFRDVLFGDPDRQTPGLVAESAEARAMVRQWRTLTTAVRWLTITFGGAAAVGLVNLATGGVG